MRRRLIFIISAPTGVGKTTLCKAIEGRIEGVRRVITHTTREKRKEEREAEGADYYFVSKQEFQKRIKEEMFVEWAEVHGNLYGTSKKALHDVLEDGYDAVLSIDVQGARNIKEEFPYVVLIFLLPPSLEEWMRRLKGIYKKDNVLRLKNALIELEKLFFFDYFVVNDSIEQAIDGLKCIVLAERQKIDASTLDLQNKVSELIVKLKGKLRNE
jgi:guanylate kinase